MTMVALGPVPAQPVDHLGPEQLDERRHVGPPELVDASAAARPRNRWPIAATLSVSRSRAAARRGRWRPAPAASRRRGAGTARACRVGRACRRSRTRPRRGGPAASGRAGRPGSAAHVEPPKAARGRRRVGVGEGVARRVEQTAPASPAGWRAAASRWPVARAPAAGRQGGTAEDRGPVQRPPERRGHLGVGDRLGRDDVDRAADVLAVDDEPHDADHVVERDPAHPLPARPDAAADVEAERQAMRGRIPPVPDSTGAVRRNTVRMPASTAGAPPPPTPRPDRRRSRPPGAPLGEHLVAPAAVEPDGRARDEHPGRGSMPASVWAISAVPSVRLSRTTCRRCGRQALVADPGARQVHHHVDPVQALGVDGAGGGIPPDGVGIVARPRTSGRTRSPVTQRRGERRADEAAGPRDGDVQRVAPPDGSCAGPAPERHSSVRPPNPSGGTPYALRYGTRHRDDDATRDRRAGPWPMCSRSSRTSSPEATSSTSRWPSSSGPRSRPSSPRSSRA